MEQQQTGTKTLVDNDLLNVLILHMSEEVKVQTELQQTLKWFGIVGGACLLGILTVGIYFNIQQVDTKLLVEKVKGKIYYLDRTLNKHLDKH